MKYTTRIAPSPTGNLHLGTARTAYFCWLAARASGGKFILRIDDTDAERHNEEAVNVIYQAMEWLGLDYDETFRQSQRKRIYVQIANELLDAHLAVALDNGAIALKWDANMPRVFHDEIAGDIPITDTNIEQIDRRLILLRGGDKQDQPTYQFTSIVDDFHYEVNYIIRGVDHITNTPKQIAIWWALSQWSVPKPKEIKFAHVGLIFKDGKKMSKRDGAASLLTYKEQGYSRDALLNFMLRLGWGPRKDDKSNAIISKQQALGLFLTEGKMRNSNAGFDQAKLDWYKKVYSRVL